MRVAPPRYLVMTPGITGADGISAASRLTVRALAASSVPGTRAHVAVLSLGDPPDVGWPDSGGVDVQVAGAAGRKGRFIAMALGTVFNRVPSRRILCLHLALGPMAQLAARRSRMAIFLHGIEAWRPLRRLERFALHRADILMANSAHTVRRFQEANPQFANRAIHVCHLGIGYEPIVPGRAPESLPGMRPGTFALIVGRMAAEERYKGHDLLIDIWPRVMAAVPGADLVVVGDGDDRARLEARAAHLGNHVSFLGRVSDGVLASLYRDCAFFGMPSRDEGFGLVFLEAMREGKACIGGVGAAAEIIDHGVTGLIVDPNDPGQVLNAVLRLFREPETRERMGRAGAARVETRFTEAHFQQRFRQLLGLDSSV